MLERIIWERGEALTTWSMQKQASLEFLYGAFVLKPCHLNPQPTALHHSLIYVLQSPLLSYAVPFFSFLPETTQMASVSTVALGNQRLNRRRTEGTSNRLRRYSHWLRWGKTKRTKLEFSGWNLRPYILLLLYVHVCIRSTDDCSRIFRILVA